MPTKLELGPLFAPGQIVATRGALELLGRTHTNPADLLRRHLAGDWGQLDQADVDENVRSLENGLRLLSNYPVGEDSVWIITEADRSVTTLLLPEEY